VHLGHDRVSVGAQGEPDHPAVGGVVTADDKALAHESVDDRSGGTLSDAQLPGELTHGHGLVAKAYEHAQLVVCDRVQVPVQLSVQQSAETPLQLRLELAIAVD
jgi:hypothetical protein